MTVALRRVQDSADFSVERLARDLAEVYDVAIDESGQVLLHQWGDEVWDPPVRIVFGDEQLRRHLRSMADGAAGVFREVPPVQAAYRLFLVHLDEEIATAVGAGSEMTLGLHGLDVVPVREAGPFPELGPDGTYEWVSAEQFRERYGREPGGR